AQRVGPARVAALTAMVERSGQVCADPVTIFLAFRANARARLTASSCAGSVAATAVLGAGFGIDTSVATQRELLVRTIAGALLTAHLLGARTVAGAAVLVFLHWIDALIVAEQLAVFAGDGPCGCCIG